MAFGKLKIKAKCAKGRGSIDAVSVIEAMTSTWEELQAAISGLSQDEQKELEDHFNQLVEDESDLGTILFGTADDFNSRLNFLDEDVKQEFTDELLA